MRYWITGTCSAGISTPAGVGSLSAAARERGA